MTGEEVKMYAAAISTDEAFEWMVARDTEFSRILKKAGAKVVHPTASTQVFLYKTPEERDRGFAVLHKHFQTARIIERIALVDPKYLYSKKRGG